MNNRQFNDFVRRASNMTRSLGRFTEAEAILKDQSTVTVGITISSVEGVVDDTFYFKSKDDATQRRATIKWLEFLKAEFESEVERANEIFDQYKTFQVQKKAANQ